MLKMSYAGWVHVQPCQCNSLIKCVMEQEIAKKFTKTPILGVQGHSR